MHLLKYLSVPLISALLLSAASVSFVSPALAEKPDWAGQGKEHKEDKEGKESKEGKHDKKEKHKDKKQKYEGVTANVSVNTYFTDSQRGAIRNYYGQQYSAGRCPPGLAKKNNGCMPPGQGKKWAMGQPLPANVVYYPVPAPVVVQLGTPPAGYKYVRVASDILLIAIGSSMIIDAVQDLGRL